MLLHKPFQEVIWVGQERLMNGGGMEVVVGDFLLTSFILGKKNGRGITNNLPDSGSCLACLLSLSLTRPSMILSSA